MRESDVLIDDADVVEQTKLLEGIRPFNMAPNGGHKYAVECRRLESAMS